MKVVLYSLKTSLLSKHKSQVSVDRRCSRVVSRDSLGDYWGSRGAYKRMAIRPHHPHQSCIPSSPLSSPSSIFTLYRGPWQLPVTAMACRPHGGVDLGRCTIVTTIRTVHSVAFPPLDPPLIQSLHTMQDLASTRRCRITDEGCLCLSRGVGERSVAGVGGSERKPRWVLAVY
jgi:hypothetical protein